MGVHTVVLGIEKELLSNVELINTVPKSDSEYLCMTNGLLHKKTRKLLAHTPNKFLLGTCIYAFDPDAKCPTFLKFLANFCSGHKDRMELIRNFM